MHTSVFLNEAVESLEVEKGKKYIDATYGQGGHFNLIKKLGGLVIGLDYDKHQVEMSACAKVYNANFFDIKKVAKTHNFVPVNGIIADLGLSMTQLKEGAKGLSYKNDTEVLDMRLSDSNITASYILNNWDRSELEHIFSSYSEDLNSSKISTQIIIHRKKLKEDWKVSDLKTVIETATNLKGQALSKTFARIFQALRIVVNNEIENLKKFITSAIEILDKGGVLVVITFHSVEDRVVKKLFQEAKKLGASKKIAVYKKRQLLLFERSATLRIFKKNV